MNTPEISKDFFACRIVLAASHRFPEIFKDFFACRVVLAENHQYPGTIQKLFCLQNWLSRKSPISRKYSKAFSPAEQYQEQVIKIPEIFEDFFACRFVLAANHQYPRNMQRRFRLQNCLSRKSSLSRKYSKSFRLQNCLSRKSTISRKYSKTFSPADSSQPEIIIIPEISKDVFACRIVLASNHQYPENTQRLFRLQKCLTRKSLISRKYSKTFFACRTVLPANHQYPGNIQRLFCLQKCLSRKSSISW